MPIMLPKPNRIPSPAVRSVLRQGKRIIGDRMEVKIQKTANDLFRCAIVVPMRVDKRATARNRIRRLISESVRHLLPRLSQGYDVVIQVKRRLPDTQTEVDSIVADLLKSVF